MSDTHLPDATPPDTDATAAEMADPTAAVSDVLAALAAAADDHLAALTALVEIPSISADPAHAADVATSAEACAVLLRAAGCQDVEVASAGGGAPAVLGWVPAADPGAPTVLLYAHHDVQPVGAGWTRDAFSPSIEDGRLYGRGTADDKAGVLVHVAAIAAWVTARGAPPVNLAVLLDGEEEIGSPTLTDLLAAHRDRLDADVLVVCDGMNHAVGVPALTCFLRGRADAEVVVSATRTAVHSGVSGGLVRDPLLGLVRTIAACVDADGEVAIPGFTDDAHRPTGAERDRMAALGFDEAGFRADIGVRDSVVLGGGDRHPYETLWLRPALSVEGLDAPAVDGAASILVAEARARVAVRLAPGQDPERARALLADHLAASVPWGLEARVTPGEALPPYRTDPDAPAGRAALAALSAGYGTPAVAIGVGGSIPFVAEASEALGGIPALITAVADPRTNAHGPDESLDLDALTAAARSEVLLLARLAEVLSPTAAG